MVHYILLHVPEPKPVNESYGVNHKSWDEYRNKELKLSSKDTQILTTNVLLIKVENGLPDLGKVLSGIGSLRYRYAVLGEEKEIEWHEVNTP